MKKRIPGIPRKIELCVAAAGIVMLWPLFALVSILIKLSSRGEVFFRQTRIGYNGEPFVIFKFRTMRKVPSAVNLTSAGDERVTLVGRLLRRTKIDELPQLWNVVRGDMALVGPRPEVPEYVDMRNPLWVEILSVRPGLTDPITLRLRNEEHLLADIEDKVGFYIETLQPFKLRGLAWFVRNKTWKTDLRIIGRTFLAIAFPALAPVPTREELSLVTID